MGERERVGCLAGEPGIAESGDIKRLRQRRATVTMVLLRLTTSQERRARDWLEERFVELDSLYNKRCAAFPAQQRRRTISS